MPMSEEEKRKKREKKARMAKRLLGTGMARRAGDELEARPDRLRQMEEDILMGRDPNRRR